MNLPTVVEVHHEGKLIKVLVVNCWVSGTQVFTIKMDGGGIVYFLGVVVQETKK